MKKISSRISIFLFPAFFLCSCYYGDNGSSGTSTPPPSGTVSFETDVIPIFNSQCTTTGCHSGGAPAGSLNLSADDSDVATVYDTVLLQIDVDDPESSDLLAKASGSVSHSPGEVISTTSEDYQTILSWIEDGAPEN